MAQTVVAMVVVLAYAVCGVDPLIYLFFWISVSGGLGVLVLMFLTSVAVIGYFVASPNDEHAWRRRVAPALASVALLGVLVMTVAQFDVLPGVEPGSAWRWAFPSAYLAVFAAGVGWAAILRACRPDVYTAIGLGAHAATTAFGGGERPGHVPARERQLL